MQYSAILRGKARAAVSQLSQPCGRMHAMYARGYKGIPGSEGRMQLIRSLGAAVALHHALCQRSWVHLFQCFAGSPGPYDIPLRHVVSVGQNDQKEWIHLKNLGSARGCLYDTV